LGIPDPPGARAPGATLSPLRGLQRSAAWSGASPWICIPMRQTAIGASAA